MAVCQTTTIPSQGVVINLEGYISAYHELDLLLSFGTEPLWVNRALLRNHTGFFDQQLASDPENKSFA
jgi:hypothetical protein